VLGRLLDVDDDVTDNVGEGVLGLLLDEDVSGNVNDSLLFLGDCERRSLDKGAGDGVLCFCVDGA